MNLKIQSREVLVQTNSPFEYIDITEIVTNEIKESQVSAGIVVVNVLHTTASLVVQENDETIHKDANKILDRLAPYNMQFSHSYEGAVNGAAHQKQQLLGSMCVLPINDGKLTLGTWQRVFLVELFKPMKRRVQVTLIGTT